MKTERYAKGEKSSRRRELYPGYKRGIIVVFAGFLLFFIISLFVSNPLISHSFEKKDVRCYICGRKITGKYWKIGGKPICVTCYKTASCCDRCGFPSKKIYTVDGKKFCPACYNKLPQCHRCGAKLFKYWNREDADGKMRKYCPECIKKVVPRCQLCEEPLIGKYWKMQSGITGRVAYYCPECYRKSQKCYVCGLLASAKTDPLPDGRILCAHCRKRALRSRSQYLDVFRDVRKIFSEKIGLNHRRVPALKLVDLDELKEVKNEGGEKNTKIIGDNMGVFKSRKLIQRDLLGGIRIRYVSGDIFVLDNLTPEVAFWVIAHEYGHAWYEERVHTEKDPLIVEGFAEWVAYHALIKKGYKQLAESLKARNDIYGRGLGKMLEIEKNKGFDAVLEYVTR